MWKLDDREGVWIVATAVGAVCAAAAVAVPATARPLATAPTIALSSVRVGTGDSRLGTVSVQGQKIVFRGIAVDAPDHARAALQELTAAGWLTRQYGPLAQNGEFALAWTPVKAGSAKVRLALMVDKNDLAISPSLRTRVLSARCVAAPTPTIPTGDGWASGGLYVAGPYLEGGPPGVTFRPTGCDANGYTVTVTGIPNGSPTIATQHVNGSSSFAISLPPGTYNLRSTYEDQTCLTQTSVSSDQETRVDIACNVQQIP